jgi:2-keto-3-deoxy-L-rhamnonate aldolase RhmA
VVPLIENPDAVEHIDEICALEQVHMLAFGSGDFAYAIGEDNNMTDSPKVREAYLKVHATADRHGVAVIGGPVFDPTVEGCQAALRDGIRVFCLGLDVMGFRRFCEHTVHCANTAVHGSAYSRPTAPARDFAPHTRS